MACLRGVDTEHRLLFLQTHRQILDNFAELYSLALMRGSPCGTYER